MIKLAIAINAKLDMFYLIKLAIVVQIIAYTVNFGMELFVLHVQQGLL